MSDRLKTIRSSSAWLLLGALLALGAALAAARKTAALDPGPDEAPAYEVTVTLAADPNPVSMGLPSDILIKVEGEGTSEIPTGEVELVTGSETLCTLSLDNNGEASCPLTYTSQVVIELKAIYAGATPFLPGVSDILELVVQLPFPYETVYSNDFETSAGSEWCAADLAAAPAGQNFLGEFGNTTNCLVLDSLPAHRWVQVSFDLYLIRSWDGNVLADAVLDSFAATGRMEVPLAPDEWLFQAEGVQTQTLLHTTFTNWPNRRQAYPASVLLGDYPAQTGAFQTQVLGYTFGGNAMDSVYRLTYTFPHNDSTLALYFTALGLQELEDESWGLDNVIVRVNNMPVYQLYLPKASQ